ncbi:hypothetical protein BaRGS_00022564 [Batillaria attramentaria]|uniref:Uncharacterized protein n=1 Tax=Batillaria attramentaria TaxID=370345 RepID=A0ABD0KGS8_9CAEN
MKVVLKTFNVEADPSTGGCEKAVQSAFPPPVISAIDHRLGDMKRMSGQCEQNLDSHSSRSLRRPNAGVQRRMETTGKSRNSPGSKADCLDTTPNDCLPVEGRKQAITASADTALFPRAEAITTCNSRSVIRSPTQHGYSPTDEFLIERDQTTRVPCPDKLQLGQYYGLSFSGNGDEPRLKSQIQAQTLRSLRCLGVAVIPSLPSVAVTSEDDQTPGAKNNSNTKNIDTTSTPLNHQLPCNSQHTSDFINAASTSHAAVHYLARVDMVCD